MTTADKIHDLRLFASELKTTKANEASTRFKLIDGILFDLLGWTKDDITVEDRVDEDGTTEFSDYIISTGRQSILIEAKKIGASFDGVPKGRKSFLRGTWMTKPVGAPIRQARDYARRKSVGFCIATNGICWILFPINRRDQISFENSSCLIFPDIDSILADDIEAFKDALSRSSVISGSLDRSLLGSDRDQNEPRRLNNIYDRSFSRVDRASIFKHIEREIIAAFNESLLSDNTELLEKCYVTTSERTRFDSRIQMYLAPREQVLKTRPIRPHSKGGGAIQRILKETSLTTRPIALLTLGLVGAGKTTFLNHTAKISAKEIFANNSGKQGAHWLYIDFRDFSASQNPREFIFKGIFEYIKKNDRLKSYENSVKHAYADEIESIVNGPLAAVGVSQEFIGQKLSEMLLSDYQKIEPYALKIIQFASKSTPVFLVVDNVDQIEESEVQSKIFLEATAIARTFNSNLILAMRDATYVKNRSSAVFDAFDFDAVYIEPPNILSVLSKRFAVAEQLMRGQRIRFEADGGALVDVRDGKLIIELLSQSVLGTEVGRIIEVAATGDTRLALRMTRQFLQYGYSSTARAVQLYQRTGKYILPPHEALRAIMLGNQGVYRENYSVFGNPFDAQLGRSDLQLLRLYVMYTLVLYSSQREFEGLPAREIIESLERLGISEASSERIIKDLLKFRYVFSRSHQDYTRESIIIPSRLCGYVSRELVGRLVFIETAMFDTFIGDDATWDAIKENMRQIYRERKLVSKLGIRREVALLFFEFVEQKLELHVSAARARGLGPQWCVNALTRIKEAFLEDIHRALSSAMRNYGPSAADDEKNLPLFLSNDRLTE